MRISEAIQRLGNDHGISHRQFAEWAGCSTSTVQRWSIDDSEPSESHIHRLLSPPTPLEVSRLIEATLPRRGVPADADINGDGVVDMDDVLDGAAAIVTNTAKVQEVLRIVTKDGEISPPERAEVHAVCDQLESLRLGLLNAVDANVTERRQARPLRYTEGE